MQIETRPLQGDSPGTQRLLTLYRYGKVGQGPKVYLQAGLHADEMPGVLVLQHLLPLLDAAEACGKLTGEVLVVPAANPIGLAQWRFQRPLGRHEADSGQNFNRGYADLAALVADGLAAVLTEDAAQNCAVIREAFRQALSRVATPTDLAELRVALMQWSCDADYVLDLHCDQVAVPHLYASPARPDDTSLLCRATGAQLALIQDISGGNAFDEAHTAPWLLLQRRYPDHPIPAACFATTLEYRGQFDVDDATASSDARNLMAFLGAIGAVRGGEALAYPDAIHLPLGGALEAFAPQGGVVTWAAHPGETVIEGTEIAHVTDPFTRRRLPVLAPCDGILFRRELWPSCLRGQSLCHVAGAEVRRSGDLLSD